jgi:Na+-transporting NADH:ubiquinone oxidoreductase subunit C
MPQFDTKFTIGFAAAVCGVCSVFVAGSVVALKDRQEENKVLDRQSKVLIVAGLMQEGEPLSRDEIKKRYAESVVPVVVDLSTGEPVEGVDPSTFDQRAEMADPATSEQAPDNPAKVRRLPKRGILFQIKEGDAIKSLVLPIEGKGLWSTLYGYLSLNADGRTIDGITFYQHGETPGLGGEVDNVRWKELWKGRKAFDEQWERWFEVFKGSAGAAAVDR